jgi:hypothetical protein
MKAIQKFKGFWQNNKSTVAIIIIALLGLVLRFAKSYTTNHIEAVEVLTPQEAEKLLQEPEPVHFYK